MISRGVMLLLRHVQTA